MLFVSDRTADHNFRKDPKDSKGKSPRLVEAANRLIEILGAHDAVLRASTYLFPSHLRYNL